jgi:hypothetical protein
MDNIKVILKVISQSLGEFEIDMEPDEVYNLSPEIDIKHLYELSKSDTLFIKWRTETLLGCENEVWSKRGALDILYNPKFTLSIRNEIRLYNPKCLEVLIVVTSYISEDLKNSRSIYISEVLREYEDELHAYRFTMELPY